MKCLPEPMNEVKNMKFKILCLVGLFVIFIALLQSMIISHEEVHAKQCKYFGGISTTRIGFLEGDVLCNALDESNEQLYMVQASELETITFLSNNIVNVVFVLLAFLILLKDIDVNYT